MGLKTYFNVFRYSGERRASVRGLNACLRVCELMVIRILDAHFFCSVDARLDRFVWANIWFDVFHN